MSAIIKATLYLRNENKVTNRGECGVRMCCENSSLISDCGSGMYDPRANGAPWDLVTFL